jgi:hypothetical protein
MITFDRARFVGCAFWLGSRLEPAETVAAPEKSSGGAFGDALHESEVTELILAVHHKFSEKIGTTEPGQSRTSALNNTFQKITFERRWEDIFWLSPFMSLNARYHIFFYTRPQRQVYPDTP